jgi:transposase
MKVQLLLTHQQRKVIDEWINTSRYVYNKTVNEIENNKKQNNFINLRNLLVTSNTKMNHPEYIKIKNKINKYYEKKQLFKKLNNQYNKLNNDNNKLLNKLFNLKTNKINNNILVKINDINTKLNDYAKYKNNNIIKKKFGKLIKKNNINDYKLYFNFLSEKFIFTYLIYKLDVKINKANILLKNTAKKLEFVKKENIKNWELNTPKEIRAGAVKDVCKAYDTCFSQLKSNIIRHFKIKFKKKTDPKKSIVISPNFLKIINKNNIQLAPNFLNENSKIKIKIKKQKKHQENFYKNLQINNDCRLIKQYNKYILCIPIEKSILEQKKAVNYCGIDMGVRTFATVFGNTGCYEYKHNNELIKKINKKIDILKQKRIYKPKEKLIYKINKLTEQKLKYTNNKKIIKKLEKYKHIFNTKKKYDNRNKYRKSIISKYEQKKSNLIVELHNKTINDLLNNNDVIFYGDIKSHDIVKHKNHTTLNKNVNDMKFYQFKKHLLEKAEEKNKLVYIVHEAYTTQYCSFCGNLNKFVGSSEIYKCKNINCKIHIGRDINAAKNMLMKGIVNNIL